MSQKARNTGIHVGLKHGKETFHCGTKGKIKLRKELSESTAEKLYFSVLGASTSDCYAVQQIT